MELIYLLLVYFASLVDYKKREIPDTIHICIILLAVIYKEMHLTGLLIGVFFLLISLKYNCIGGGDIKFLLATGLAFGFIKTYLMLLLASILLSVSGLILYIKSKIKKEEFKEKGLPLMPFFFISSFLIIFK